MSMCSAFMVFLCNWLQMSFASELSKWMNSVQQLRTNSLASLAIRTEGTNSLIILFRLALGRVSSSSSAFPKLPE